MNLAKCEFGATNVNYLGYRLTPEGILPGLDKLKAVRDSKMPTNVQEIRQFMGLCNFFRAHVRNFSLIGAPLNRLTSKAADWKDGVMPKEGVEAYNSLKQALLSEPIVDYPRKNRPYSLIVDASTGTSEIAGGLGAILTQTDENNDEKVIAHASRKLLKHEKTTHPFWWKCRQWCGAWNILTLISEGENLQCTQTTNPLKHTAKGKTRP